MRWAIVVALLLVTPGCITYTTDRLPQRSYSDVRPKRGRPAVSYTLDVGPIIGPENPKGPELFDERVQSVFATAGAFSNVTRGAAKDRCTIRLSLNHRRDLGEGWTVLFCCSLTLLPAYAENHWTLDAVVERGGQVLKSYRYEDATASWFETFLIFGYPFASPGAAATKLFDNMLLNLLRDAFEDGVLADDAGVPVQPPPLSAGGPTAPSEAKTSSLDVPRANAPAASKDDR
ncbi:MAG: hypothetical protein ACAI25_16540 [Planctomycetota bacterium]